MTNLFFFALICLTLSRTLPNKEDSLNRDGLVEQHQLSQRAQWHEWKATHKKSYAAEEEKLRFQNFQASLARVERLNARGGATYAINQFSDMSPKEFRSFYYLNTPIKHNETANKNRQILPLKKMAAPAQFDWRDKGAVTPVKNQEQCGSCWAFSATEAIESAWMLKHGLNATTMAPLAPQQIVDCDTMDGGCNGGNPPTAFQYVISAGGMDREIDYPYHAVNQNCAFQSGKIYASISSWSYACSYYEEETLLNSLVQHGPPSICVDAANWQDYSSGVMTSWECAWINQLDHCVQAVGYDTSASTPYWIVRNSWGTSWGEKGFIRLQYGHDTCGLTHEASQAVSA
jgi:C1A family cysteine protease